MIAALDAAAEALTALSRPGFDRGEVHVIRRGAMVEIVLDHPEARHAISTRMQGQLARAVRLLWTQPVSVVIVRSASPGAFCSGGYLPEVRAALLAPDAAAVMSTQMTVVLDALWNAPAVSFACLTGPAVGGGAELAWSCDRRLVAPAGSIVWRQVPLGVAAGWGGAHRLVAAVGRQAAVEGLCGGATWDADALVRKGWADAWEGAAEACPAVLELLSRPVAAVRAAKAQIVAATRGDRQGETDAVLSVWGGAAHRAALGVPEPTSQAEDPAHHGQA